MDHPQSQSEPPARSITFSIKMPSTDGMPAELVLAFSKSLAEAQLLELSLKRAISNDIAAFAAASAQPSFLDALEQMTLGQAKCVSTGQCIRSDHKDLAKHVGFFVLVKMQWAANGRSEGDLEVLLAKTVKQRNRIAHSLLAEVISGSCSEHEAIEFLGASAIDFINLRILVTAADSMSGKLGSVAADGSTLSRLKVTN